MEKDFHYHLIYAISKITGFEKADIIASSSQFVDDNNEREVSGFEYDFISEET